MQTKQKSTKMIARLLEAKLKKSSKSILLLGPRQTGKSTLIKNLKTDLIINLANESEFIKISSDPDLFESRIKSFKRIFVDEVQRIPSLLNTIQEVIDNSKNKNPILFYLSGSSARKLRRGQANLLPGRLLTYNLGGLCLKELNYNVDFKKALSVGFLPELYLENNKSNSQKLLESYSHTYLKEEIQAEAVTRNLQGFMRFLNQMAEVAGQSIDYSKLSTKAKVARTSIIRFIEILEDTLIGQRVEVFSLAESADTIKHPKFYFFDPGVLNGLLSNFTVSPDRIGILFEHLIFAQIKNSSFALDKNIKLEYFRTRNGVEVDFILTLNNQVYAIEVKSGEVSRADISSLKNFRNYYPKVKKCYVVSLKEKQRSLDDIIICGVSEFFKDIGL